jgi:23S rRNA (cytosine1962-C5)-methyltransferase
VQLVPGRDYPVRHGHPWIFSGAFRALPPDLSPGAVADVLDSAGAFVARGYLNVHNSLAFRLLTRDPDEPIDEALYVRRIERAAALRRLLPQDVTAYRLVHAEGDGLPGLIVDRYDRCLVAQFHTAGVERDREPILAALVAVVSPAGIVARDEIRVRGREGLSIGEARVVYGEVPDLIEVREGPVRYLVDTRAGQKTGFYLDQRDKRLRIVELARAFPRYAQPSPTAGGSSDTADADRSQPTPTAGRTQGDPAIGRSQPATMLLNCFSYTGGFALAALAGNPALHTVNVDSSGPALELARRNYALNGHDPDAHEFADVDVTRYLDRAVDTGRRFAIVVVDPPAFAKTQRDKERALRAYEHLNQLSARVVAPGGLLLTSSCSGAVDFAEFEGAVRSGLLRAERQAQILEIFTSSLDHPTLPAFPEDRYLKALLLRVL